ncbi:hypothetical protein MtrunA17_Chr4g0007671 [Medicago truncatula]|uniref:Uncharacterized protein n=1 Tax=Medicago truncatula TaxID=3880 RepID=A0A396I023_MEDTR|nr:hypothetical protein MtrunA17_Chr4g0007671 [Medicago truncatula]
MKFEADSRQKYEDSMQKYQTQPVPQQFKAKKPSQRVGTACASSGTTVPPPQHSFCCFYFSDKLPV